jgi:hypothetical protein
MTETHGILLESATTWWGRRPLTAGKRWEEEEKGQREITDGASGGQRLQLDWKRRQRTRFLPSGVPVAVPSGAPLPVGLPTRHPMLRVVAWVQLPGIFPASFRLSKPNMCPVPADATLRTAHYEYMARDTGWL